MNDNEIIKALECCKKDDCDNCPNDFGNRYSNLAGYALEIINRQKAEIEDFKEKIEDYKHLSNHKPVNIWNAKEGYGYIDSLVKEMVGEEG